MREQPELDRYKCGGRDCEKKCEKQATSTELNCAFPRMRAAGSDKVQPE